MVNKGVSKKANMVPFKVPCLLLDECNDMGANSIRNNEVTS